MKEDDTELEAMRVGVCCPVLLEKAGYALDERESTARNLKYRRGAGETIIVNHGGRGWWDTGSTSKGDVFSLAQHLDPSLNFGQVRKLLRGMVGLRPSCPPAVRARTGKRPPVPAPLRWGRCRRLRPGSGTWAYLAAARGLPRAVLAAADAADAVREGPYAAAWFAYRDQGGAVTGIEMRGPDYRGFSDGGDKSLFRLPGSPGRLSRLAVCEAPVDALSLAALEALRGDTLYLSTAGGMGPCTIACLQALLGDLAGAPDAVLLAAGDNDPSGERYARHLAELARAAGVRWDRLRPPAGLKDWNDALRRDPAPKLD